MNDSFRTKHPFSHRPEVYRCLLRVLTVILLALAVALPSFASAAPATGSETHFIVTVENISGSSVLPSPFAPGVYAVHDSDVMPFFEADMPDRGDGLEALAEDGSVGALAAAVAGTSGVSTSGIYTQPVGSDMAGPIFPGDRYRFHITASPGDQLSLANMFVQSNDLFIAPVDTGIALFDGDGMPIYGDISDMLPLWDAGTEVNEAPGMGPNQAPRQSAANTGPSEGGVSAFSNSTRSLPLAGGIVDVSVVESSGMFSVTVSNVSATSGSIVTPIAPVFYATHNDEWSLFMAGDDASAGLESLAEDGSPVALVGEHSGAAGTGMVGAQPITVERPGDAAGPAFPGESYQFSVMPTAGYPYLTIAMMVVQTNDVFLAFDAMGIALLDEEGDPRAAGDIEADIERMLAVWDAGTEANEVPGVGLNQAPRQSGPSTGPVDPMSGVRLYNDATNDLAGENAGGFAEISVVNGASAGMFDITLTNTSTETVYPGLLTPVAWAIHNGDTQLFSIGEAASAGLESLAEDGDPATLAGELGINSDVVSSGVAAMPVGAAEAGPLMPGASYTFTVSADSDHRYLSVASMIVPSNDTFFAFEPMGLRILNADGTSRSDEEIATDVTAMRLAWNAGTERNQAGAAGPDQAPRQVGPNTGADEGAGTVSLASGDTVWTYPSSSDVVRVTIMPFAKVFLPAIEK